MYTDEKIIDKIEILESGHIQVREATKVYKDGVEIAKQYNRYVISPGDTVDGKEQIIQQITAVVHTQEVIDRYKNKIK